MSSAQNSKPIRVCNGQETEPVLPSPYARLKRGLSVAEVAENAGVSVASVSFGDRQAHTTGGKPVRSMQSLEAADPGNEGNGGGISQTHDRHSTAERSRLSGWLRPWSPPSSITAVEIPGLVNQAGLSTDPEFSPVSVVIVSRIWCVLEERPRSATPVGRLLPA